MITYIFKRLIYMIPTLLGITLVTFLIIKLAPGDPARQFDQTAGKVSQKSQQVASENIEEFRRLYGLDRPLQEQYLIWMKRLVKFDFGRSINYKNVPVSELLITRLGVTLQISVAAVFLIYLISIPMGVFLAVKEGTVGDRILTVAAFVAYSLPSFFIGLLLLNILASNDIVSWFPSRGLQDPELALNAGFFEVAWDRIHHLFLPILVTAVTGLTYLAMQMRGNMLEVLRQDYIRTARAKGLQEKVVVFKHAMRNSLIPIITIFASVLPTLIGGAVIIETVFQVDGMGKFGFEAVLMRDYNVIMAVAILSAVLTLVGILISDILYVLIDPRISFD